MFVEKVIPVGKFFQKNPELGAAEASLLPRRSPGDGRGLKHEIVEGKSFSEGSAFEGARACDSISISPRSASACRTATLKRLGIKR
ncbi:MAG: hypothetical protein LBL72_09385 [Candidatus Accumulibacter sp.]|nr:hypothetical protein [Accumulibacter sp.]